MSDWRAAFVYAFRTLRRQPTFVLIALLTLGLGIGANTAIFSVIKTVVLNPLPYADPERIVVLWEVNPDGNQDRVSIPTYEDWKKEARSIESLAAFRQVDFTFAGSGEPRNVPGVRATPELFSVLKANAELGRTFTADEGVWGADNVVVVSRGFWERVLGTDRSIIGKTIQLDSLPITVVGVMPQGFEFPTAANAEVWMPLAFNPKDMHGASRRARSLMVVGRLAPGATAAGAQEELTVLASRIAAAYKDSNEGWSARLIAAHEQLVSASRPALMVLMGAVLFLLLIVCANMANLLLARLSSRRREIAVRGALGASRMDVARPILAESILLSFGGAALGLVLAVVGLRIIAALPDARLPRMDQLHLDGGVLLFTMIVSVAVALGFGVLPALHASRSDLRQSMGESSGGATTSLNARRVLSGLVVIEVALALVLLVGAGLMTRSFSKLLQVSPGFDTTNLVAARVLLPTAKYRERQTLVTFYESVIERLRQSPGVTSASAVSALPLQDVGAASALPFNVEGQQPPPTEDPAGRRAHGGARLLRDHEDPPACGPLPRRARRAAGAAHQRDQRDDGAPVLPGSQPPRADHPEPARQERGGGRGGRRAQPGPGQRAEEAGVPAAEAEPHGGHGAGGAHRGRPHVVCGHHPEGHLGSGPAAAHLRALHDEPDHRARGVPAAAVDDAAVAVCGGGAAAGGAGDLRRALVFRLPAHARDWPSHGARRLRRRHGGASSSAAA